MGKHYIILPQTIQNQVCLLLKKILKIFCPDRYAEKERNLSSKSMSRHRKNNTEYKLALIKVFPLNFYETVEA